MQDSCIFTMTEHREITVQDQYLNKKKLPFESYPNHGRQLMGRVSGVNCRYGYGLKLQQLTGQVECAYCGISLVENYEIWLTMAIDHVVPDNVCKSLGISEEWNQDYSNRVLCCTACNTFGNRYEPKNIDKPVTLEEFYQLRDRVFVERKALILERHRQEYLFFEQKPWTRRL